MSSRDDHVAVQAIMLDVTRMLLILPLGRFIERINKTQTIGPILDPTAYREGGETLQRLKEIAEALNTAKTKILEIQKSLVPRAPEEPPIEKVQEALTDAETMLIAKDPEVQAGLQEFAESVMSDVKLKEKKANEDRPQAG